MIYTINIGNDFSETPAGRYSPEHGEYTGERFRNDFLIPLLKKHGNLAVELDDTEGYPASFLEEAFGGLVRHEFFTKEELNRRLHILTNFKHYEKEILEYINDAIPGSK